MAEFIVQWVERNAWYQAMAQWPLSFNMVPPCFHQNRGSLLSSLFPWLLIPNTSAVVAQALVQALIWQKLARVVYWISLFYGGYTGLLCVTVALTTSAKSFTKPTQSPIHVYIYIILYSDEESFCDWTLQLRRWGLNVSLLGESSHSLHKTVSYRGWNVLTAPG